MRKDATLIASGRDADIYEAGPGLVVRRSRGGRSLAREAHVMEYVRSKGFPVPAVDGISDDGTELVMERLDGVSMLEGLVHRPWRLRDTGAMLADLHRALHVIDAPEWIPGAPAGTGDRVVHLDLHPLNVMMTARGPFVIDWSNAARGDPHVDVALTWLLLAAGAVSGNPLAAWFVAGGRAVLLGGFLNGCDRAAAGRHLDEISRWKGRDPNISPSERAAIQRVAITAHRWLGEAGARARCRDA
ncbi:MAG: phosphotransferase [Acidimicrobiales bacterium]